MSSDNPWPPEGTRVRLITKNLFNGCKGRLLGPSKFIPNKYVVKLHGNCLAVYRHEIEVINE